MDEITKALQGHSIISLHLHHSREMLAIVIGGSNYLLSVLTLDTEGDCCSQSFIEHIGNPEACHMARFEAFVEVEVEPNVDTLSDDERQRYTSGELKFYYFKIITDKGETLIEMRNESNGYYGGWLKFGRVRPYLDWDPDPALWPQVS